MHVLHRPHDLRRAALATVAAAVLAIVLTLALATGLSDMSSNPTPAGAPASRGPAHLTVFTPPASNPLAPGPFAFAAKPLPWLSSAR